MADITSIFGGPFVPPSDYADPPETQLADAMESAGLTPPPSFKFDGQLHRFSTNGRKGDDAGWYVVYPDNIPAGAFGSWRDGVQVNWRAKAARPLTPAEQMAQAKRVAEAKAMRDAEAKRRQEIAADTVAAIWSSAAAASADHPYLKRKGIQPNGARISGDGRLIVPLFGPDGELATLQYISADGDKIYHPGGKAGGSSYTIGEADRIIYVAEGFATAATIHEAAGHASIAAYSASNIPAVTAQARERYGLTAEIVIVADHDPNGVGRNYADQASAKYGARVVMPPIPGMDANDYVQAGHDLMALLHPPSDGWLIPADEMASQPAPLSWLIKRWLPDNALIMVHGPSGGGKTFVVLDWCLRIASAATDWFGTKVKPGRVIYLAGEGHHGLRGRVAAWKQHHKAGSLNMWLSRDGCDLNTPEGYQRVTDSIRGLDAPPSLIVVDTLHRFLMGDENSAQDAKTMIDACAGLMREFGCSVLLVHHTGVSDEAQHRARGSSAWKGALEAEFNISVKGDTITLRNPKMKDAPQADDIHLELQSVTIDGWLDEDGEPVTSAVIVEGVAPSPKVDDKLTVAIKLFTRAWHASGADVSDGSPYVTKSALEALMEGDGLSAASIRSYVKPSFEKGPIARLINADQIAPHQHGWIAIDPVLKSQLLISK